MTELPQYHDTEEYRIRVKKLQEIRAAGIDPYPAVGPSSDSILAIQESYKETETGNSEAAMNRSTPIAIISGRLMLFRPMGKNIFGQLEDASGRLQIMFNRDVTTLTGYSSSDITPFKFIEKKTDLGDFLSIQGNLFRTQKGELTLLGREVTFLSKSLLPLPDKHVGLTDKGLRYKKRWLDLIDHSDVRKTFQMRSQIIRIIRNFFDANQFIEVETPVLQNIYGGAAAKPFATHLHSMDQEMFLRISLEIPLKKLIIGGLEKIFEIGKVFRNEGIDRTHNPEFTMLEAYAAYWDYFAVMDFIEKIYSTIALELLGTTVIGPFTVDGKEVNIDLKAPWKRLTMREAIQTYSKIDTEALSESDMIALLQKTPINKKKLQNTSRGLLISYLFEEFAEKHLIQPHHIYDHPIETTPLCKPHRNPKLREKGLVERFETFILGVECCNAYSELNDPLLQRKLLEKQVSLQQAGDAEAHPMDEEFVEALCQGMPPTGGFGIGIDRLVMLFTKCHSIRDVLFFPIVKSDD
ncbi:MAG: lysine--tRNA ligase [Chlamydiales bacterium]